jgi:histidinol-phosphate phosphatase family protein
MIPLNNIDQTWTLFLDRDGVINHEKHKDYIHTWDEFVFYDGVHDAIKTFSLIFNKIIVVTNQKGVGKGLTLFEKLTEIHNKMKSSIQLGGGRIDAIYFCPDLDENSPNRKPNAGMGYQAKKDFSEIDFSKSIMVGNTLSDMEFGRNIGAFTVFLPTTRPEVEHSDTRIDLVQDSLFDFSKTLLNR